MSSFTKKLLVGMLCFTGLLMIIIVSYMIFNHYRINTVKSETIITQVIERQFPVFRMASFQINYTGRIRHEGNDYIFNGIRTGSYSSYIEYDAEILIGTRTHPRVILKDETIIIDFSEVTLEVIAVTPTRLELINASTSGWRWFIGGGIPINDGLFNPFIAAINEAPSILNEQPDVQERAMQTLVNYFRDFYSIFNQEIEVNL